MSASKKPNIYGKCEYGHLYPVKCPSCYGKLIGLNLGRPDPDLDYLTPHTGGSIRHKNIRAVDCLSALFDFDRAWAKYHEQEMARIALAYPSKRRRK